MTLFWVIHFKYLLKRIFSSVQSLNRVRLSATLWTAACKPSLSITSSWSLLKLMLVMPSNHLIHCHPLLLLSIIPTIRVFSNDSVLCIRRPKDWSFSISPSDEYSGLISFIHMVFLFCIFKQLCYICFVLNGVAKKQFKHIGAVSWLLRMTFFLISLIL